MYEILKERYKERQKRMARCKMNQVAYGGIKIDYLTTMREKRQAELMPSKPYDWKDILHKSRMMVRGGHRSLTYLTHLSARGTMPNHVASTGRSTSVDNKSPKKKKQS